MSKEKEIAIFLAGLLSTDGYISKKSSGSFHYKIYSCEYDWREIMRQRLEEVGIIAVHRGTKNECHCLYLRDPEKVTRFLIDNNCEAWFNPRKWKRILDAYSFYSRPDYRKVKRWTRVEEEELIKRKIIPLGRTKDAARKKRSRLES